MRIRNIPSFPTSRNEKKRDVIDQHQCRRTQDQPFPGKPSVPCAESNTQRKLRPTCGGWLVSTSDVRAHSCSITKLQVFLESPGNTQERNDLCECWTNFSKHPSHGCLIAILGTNGYSKHSPAVVYREVKCTLAF